MKRLAFLALLLLPLKATASMSLSSGTYTGTMPTLSYSNFSLQTRISSWTYNGSIQDFRGTTSFDFRIGANSGAGFFFTSWSDSSAQCSLTGIAAGTDVILRFARNVASSQIECSAISPQTGAILAQQISPVTLGSPNDSGVTIGLIDPSGTCGGGTHACIAYMRTYTAYHNPLSTPGNTFDGNIEDFEFESNLTDMTGHVTLAGSGASYATTPVYPPVVSVNSWPTFTTVRAGKPFQLINQSFTASDNETLSNFWNQLSGPISGTFSNRTSSAPTFTSVLTGQYTLQDTVTDTTTFSQSIASTTIGFVATDYKTVVISGLDSLRDNLLGPMVNYGASPWPYGDLSEASVASNLGNTALLDPPQLGTPLSGTVSWTSGTVTLATTANLTSPLSGESYIIFTWNSIDGTGTGRGICPISSVNSTQVICQINITAPTSSGMTAYKVAPTDGNGINFLAWTAGTPSVLWNYYDVAIGLYRLYWRTGIASYLSLAQQFADINWQWMIDHGYQYPAPRAASMVSQFYRALEAHPERFPGLYNEVSSMATAWASSVAGSPFVDNRESGYALWDIALGAKTDPDPTRHTQYCTWLTTYVPLWIKAQAADGSWPEQEYALNQGFVSAPKTFVAPFLYQGAAWREAINLKSMEAAYESLNDTSAAGCSSTTLATSTLQTIQNAETWVNNFGRDTSNRGIFYEVNSQSADQSTVFRPGGLVSIAVGTTTITGAGTGWNSAGYCDGTHFIGIEASLNVYKIASCVSNTTATLTTAYGLYGEVTNVINSQYSVAPAASTGCSSSASYCFGSVGDRNLVRTGCGSMGWLYNQTGVSSWKTMGDECASSTLGGPATGPTASNIIGGTASSCSGPSCDGFITDIIAAAPDCSAGAPSPCTPGAYIFSNLGKNFGEAFGAPGMDNELAWSVGGVSPFVGRAISVGFKLSSVSNATKVKVSFTEPDGVIVSSTCTTSPCPLVVDQRQGSHLIQLQYLSSGNSVLATGSQQIQGVQ